MTNPLDEALESATLDECYQKLGAWNKCLDEGWTALIKRIVILEREEKAQWAEKQEDKGKPE